MPSPNPLNRDEDREAYEKMIQEVQDLSAGMVAEQFGLTKEQVFSLLERFSEISQTLQGQLMEAQRSAIRKQLASMREMWETAEMGKAMAERDVSEQRPDLENDPDLGPKTDKEREPRQKNM